MSEIALYNLLKRIPNATDDEAKEAIADVASSKEVATKVDIIRLESFVKEGLAKLETRLTWRLVFIVSIAVGIIKYL